MECQVTDKQYVGIMIEVREDLLNLKKLLDKGDQEGCREALEEFIEKTERKINA